MTGWSRGTPAGTFGVHGMCGCFYCARGKSMKKVTMLYVQMDNMFERLCDANWDVWEKRELARAAAAGML